METKKVNRNGLSVEKGPWSKGYNVTIHFSAEEKDLTSDPGFINCQANIRIPFDIGDGLTVDQFYEKAFEVFDEMKHLL
jgi:hypothetical protein